MEISKVYSFRLSPSDEIIKEIERFKLFSRETIGAFESMNSKAHLTICEPRLEKLQVMVNSVKRLERELKSIPSIELTVNNFGYFDNGKAGYVIYAKVEGDERTKTWFKTLRSSFDKKEAFNPHITVVRGISADRFRDLWPHFEHFAYRRKFTVDSMIILENEIVKKRRDQIFAKLFLGAKNILLRETWTLFDQTGDIMN